MNPLHGVESSVYGVPTVGRADANPLHGVEREVVATVQSESDPNGIHYMELKVPAP